MAVLEMLKSVPGKISFAVKSVGQTASEFKNVSDVASAVDAMTEIPQNYISTRVNALRLEHPDATPAEIIEILGQRFRKSSAYSSGATGAVAAFPGIGTVAGLGVSSAQFVAFLGQAGLYVLSVAHVYGVPTEDKEMRRMLVMSSILGEDATELVTAKLGFSSIRVMRSSFQQISTNASAKVNSFLANRVKKLLIRKGATSIFGKIMPFGIGAGVGWFVGHKMAHQVIKGTGEFLGPVPATFSFPIIVDATLTEESSL